MTTLSGAEAYRRAGADMLFVLPKSPDEVRRIGETLGGPLLFMTTAGGIDSIGMSLSDLAGLGYRLIVDPATPLLAAHRAMRLAYAAMAEGLPDPALQGSAREERRPYIARSALPTCCRSNGGPWSDGIGVSGKKHNTEWVEEQGDQDRTDFVARRGVVAGTRVSSRCRRPPIKVGTIFPTSRGRRAERRRRDECRENPDRAHQQEGRAASAVSWS